MNSNLNVKLTTETTVQHFAELSVNGSSKGKRKINGGPSLLEFCQEAAREFGVNSFTVTIDGAPLSEAGATAPATSVSGKKVGIAANDARGADAGDENDGPDDEEEDDAEETAVSTKSD